MSAHLRARSAQGQPLGVSETPTKITNIAQANLRSIIAKASRAQIFSGFLCDILQKFDAIAFAHRGFRCGLFFVQDNPMCGMCEKFARYE